MRNRYHAILIILASILGYLLLASFELGGSLPNRIAEDPTIRGKGKDGECMDYAMRFPRDSPPTAFTANSSSTAGISAILQLPAIMSLWCTVYRMVVSGSWTTRFHSLKRVPPDATPMQLVFLLGDDPSAPVDFELQNGLNHLSYF
jgi:hypothetical protein